MRDRKRGSHRRVPTSPWKYVVATWLMRRAGGSRPGCRLAGGIRPAFVTGVVSRCARLGHIEHYGRERRPRHPGGMVDPPLRRPPGSVLGPVRHGGCNRHQRDRRILGSAAGVACRGRSRLPAGVRGGSGRNHPHDAGRHPIGGARVVGHVRSDGPGRRCGPGRSPGFPVDVEPMVGPHSARSLDHGRMCSPSSCLGCRGHPCSTLTPQSAPGMGH